MKDHNIMSQHGITDAEFIKEFNLSPELEGKPEINEAMLDIIGVNNVKDEKEALIEKGMRPDKAQKEAYKIANKLRKEAEKNLKQVIKVRGY